MQLYSARKRVERIKWEKTEEMKKKKKKRVQQTHITLTNNIIYGNRENNYYERHFFSSLSSLLLFSLSILCFVCLFFLVASIILGSLRLKLCNWAQFIFLALRAYVSVCRSEVNLKLGILLFFLFFIWPCSTFNLIRFDFFPSTWFGFSKWMRSSLLFSLIWFILDIYNSVLRRHVVL